MSTKFDAILAGVLKEGAASPAGVSNPTSATDTTANPQFKGSTAAPVAATQPGQTHSPTPAPQDPNKPQDNSIEKDFLAFLEKNKTNPDLMKVVTQIMDQHAKTQQLKAAGEQQAPK